MRYPEKPVKPEGRALVIDVVWCEQRGDRGRINSSDAGVARSLTRLPGLSLAMDIKDCSTNILQFKPCSTAHVLLDYLHGAFIRDRTDQ